MSRTKILFTLAFTFWTLNVCAARLFDRCLLAKWLMSMKTPADKVSTWVCIAEHESNFNTSAVGPANWDGSRDHGLFQINDRYWCSPSGTACGVSCSSLEDDDITDDWKCAKRIFKAHQYQQGNGFKAWAVYGQRCSGDTSAYTAECDLTVLKSISPYVISPHPTTGHLSMRLRSLTANSEKHETAAYLEPTTGVPVKGMKRVQMNVHLKSTPAITLTGNKRNVLFPFLWVEKVAELGDAELNMLRDQLLKILRIASIVCWILVGIGVFLTILGLTMSYLSYRMKKRNREKL